MKKLILALSVLGLAGGPALAAVDFKTADANGDGQVSMDELKAADATITEDQFKSADADANGTLSEDEYAKLSS